MRSSRSSEESAVDSLFDVDVYDSGDEPAVPGSGVPRHAALRPGKAHALSASLAFASPPEQSQEALQQVRQNEHRQRERLNDLRQIGDLAREGAATETVRERRDALEQTYQKILDKNPEHLPTLNEYALLLTVGRGEHDAAEELYLAALSINPFHKRTLSDYGFFLERVRGDFDGAEVCRRVCVSLLRRSACTAVLLIGPCTQLATRHRKCTSEPST
jgi:tetratricopeptide (TPR) repeat protein